MNLAAAKPIPSAKNPGKLAKAENEFQRFKKWSRNHGNLDKKIKKDTDKRDGKKNHSVLFQA